MTGIREVQTGDELICFMRLGLALQLDFRPKDKLYYLRVPNKPRRARSGDITRFTGTVMQNNTVDEVLTMHVTEVDSHMIAFNRTVLRVDVHYSAFRRVRRLSAIAYPGRTNSYPSRPTSTEGLGTQPKAYRTLEEITL